MIIYISGSADNKRRVAGWAFTVVADDEKVAGGFGAGRGLVSSEAEVRAGLLALRWLARTGQSAIVVTGNRWFFDAATARSQPRKDLAAWKALFHLARQLQVRWWLQPRSRKWLRRTHAEARSAMRRLLADEIPA